MVKEMITIPTGCYLLSFIFLGCGVVSVYACHQNISAQLATGIAIKGNELPIILLYIDSMVPYLAYSCITAMLGSIYSMFLHTDVVKDKHFEQAIEIKETHEEEACLVNGEVQENEQEWEESLLETDKMKHDIVS